MRTDEQQCLSKTVLTVGQT